MRISVILSVQALFLASQAAAQTAGIDFLSHVEALQPVNETLVTPEGNSIVLNGQYRRTTQSYDGLGGYDFLSGTADDDYFDGSFISNIESFTLGDGDDIADFRNYGADAEWVAGAGADVVIAGSGSDSLQGGSGNDLLEGGAGDDSLRGGADTDQLFGGSGDDYLALEGDGGQAFGGADNDLLIGADNGTSLLDGGSGNDVLFAQESATTLIGGVGRDVFDVSTAQNGERGSSCPVSGPCSDYLEGILREITVTDFAFGDYLYLHNLSPSGVVPVGQQVGSDVVFQFGHSQTSSSFTRVILQNVQLADLVLASIPLELALSSPVQILPNFMTSYTLSSDGAAVPLPAGAVLLLTGLFPLIRKRRT